jgi:anaerobic magnesium-protoporphyrin IX monomethyl ester cyclase
MYTPVPLAGELYEEAKAEWFSVSRRRWTSGSARPGWSFSQRRSSTMPWIKRSLQDQIHDFERVINAYYPTTTHLGLTGGWRRVLRLASAWRYHLGFYHFPLELRALHKLIAYQRPETSSF